MRFQGAGLAEGKRMSWKHKCRARRLPGSGVPTLKGRRRQSSLGKSPNRRQRSTHRDGGALGQLAEDDPDAPGTQEKASSQ